MPSRNGYPEAMPTPSGAPSEHLRDPVRTNPPLRHGLVAMFKSFGSSAFGRTPEVPFPAKSARSALRPFSPFPPLGNAPETGSWLSLHFGPIRRASYLYGLGERRP